jgi:predicted nucleic acid-binding protein
MERVASGRHTLSGSAALIAENEQNRDEKRKAKVRELLKQATEWIPYPSDVDPRVKSLSMLGFRGFDAHHVAAAEAGECDRLVTCDDQFLKVARRAAAKMKVAITDLLSLVSEPDF